MMDLVLEMEVMYFCTKDKYKEKKKAILIPRFDFPPFPTLKGSLVKKLSLETSRHGTSLDQSFQPNHMFFLLCVRNIATSK